MFTGIVQACVRVVDMDIHPGLYHIMIELPGTLGHDLKKGNSVALDGTCLTVAAIDGDRATFEVMGETLARTTLGRLAPGHSVNVERALRSGEEVGGHAVSGHVDGTAEIIAVDKPANNHIITVRCDKSWMKYIFPKGFIALDGCSLTVAGVNRSEGTFTVHLIPETLRITTFGFRTSGDHVNLEIDRQTQAIVDTVERVLEHRS